VPKNRHLNLFRLYRCEILDDVVDADAVEAVVGIKSAEDGAPDRHVPRAMRGWYVSVTRDERRDLGPREGAAVPFGERGQIGRRHSKGSCGWTIASAITPVTRRTVKLEQIVPGHGPEYQRRVRRAGLLRHDRPVKESRDGDEQANGAKGKRALAHEMAR
jgi:hypothetical protein